MEDYEAAQLNDQSFSAVVEVLEKLVNTSICYEQVDAGPGWSEDREIVTFDGSIFPFIPTSELAAVLGFNGPARCNVVGDVDEGLGIGIAIKPLNPFLRATIGFFIQPKPGEGLDIYDPHRGFDVFIGQGKMPRMKSVSFWGTELLERETVREATAEEAAALIKTLQMHAAVKNRKNK